MPGTGEDVAPGGGVEGVADPAVEGPPAVRAASSGEQALAVTAVAVTAPRNTRRDTGLAGLAGLMSRAPWS